LTFGSDHVESIIRTFESALVHPFDQSPYTNKALSNQLAFIFAPIQEIDHFIQKELVPVMIAFKKVFMKFEFKSPLNFIMVPHDFEILYTAIYHAQQLAYYLTNFIADSVFTFDSDQHDKTH